MNVAFAEEVRRRSQSEKARKSYPEGFPVLPPIPAARYCDPAFFALEREHVFSKKWLFVAHVDELPEAGDVILLDQFPVPLLLVRGPNGQIRAFYNTCRHRGAPLLREPRARVKTRLVCQYHSWSYDLEGRLCGVPDSENFKNLDKRCLGLGAVRCESWAGLVFINLDRHAVTLREFLAPIMRTMDEEIGDAAGKPLAFRTEERDSPARQLEARDRRQYRDLPRQHRSSGPGTRSRSEGDCDLVARKWPFPDVHPSPDPARAQSAGAHAFPKSIRLPAKALTPT